MSESDGVEEAIESVGRAGLMAVARAGEEVGRTLEQRARRREAELLQEARENSGRARATEAALGVPGSHLDGTPPVGLAEGKAQERALEMAAKEELAQAQEWHRENFPEEHHDWEQRYAAADSISAQQSDERALIRKWKEATTEPGPKAEPDPGWFDRHEAHMNSLDAQERAPQPLAPPSPEVAGRFAEMVNGEHEADLRELVGDMEVPLGDAMKQDPSTLLVALRATAEMKVNPNSPSAEAAMDVLELVKRDRYNGTVHQADAQRLTEELRQVTDPAAVLGIVSRSERIKESEERDNAQHLIEAADRQDAASTQEAAHATYDSAERRGRTASELKAGGVDAAVVETHLRTDVGQGKPASAAVMQKRASKARKGKPGKQQGRDQQLSR